MQTYTRHHTEHAARSAALAGFTRGMDWARAQPTAYAPITIEELRSMEDSVIGRLIAEGWLEAPEPAGDYASVADEVEAAR